MAETTIRYVVRFSGQVRGVGFRATTIAVARGLEVNGIVRNEPDGSVKLDVDGTEQVLKELLKRIESAMAGRIDDLQIDSLPSLERKDGLRIEY